MLKTTLDTSWKIGIVGLGLMGGSYARALSEQGYEVGALDLREEAVRFALEKGWIAHGRSEPDAEWLGQFDLLVFALYPDAFLSWLESYQHLLKPGALLTDVTGVKGRVIGRVQEMLRPDLEFIGAHPMAGREKSGVEYATKEIFRGANYLVVPTEKNTPEAVAICRQLGETLGFRRVTELTIGKHDEMIAYLSQLTHCIAVSLMTCRDTTSMIEYTGDSFRDLTRIGRINDEMWSELFLMNRDALLEQMDIFSAAFGQLRDSIARGDREEIRRIMRLSTQRRGLFDKEE